ncbi:helix-turn-helix domain-containing protein [Bradyrhizobium sp. RDT10]
MATSLFDSRQSSRDAPPVRAPGLFSLTRQERRCLQWCKEGKTNWEISEILSISEKTVEFHLANAMKKLGAPNRITAVVSGIKLGLISL